MNSDRNPLGGGLALQNALIDSKQLTETRGPRAARNDNSLAEILRHLATVSAMLLVAGVESAIDQFVGRLGVVDSAIVRSPPENADGLRRAR